MEGSSFGLYHFHIDTSSDNIQLNKFKTSPADHSSTFDSRVPPNLPSKKTAEDPLEPLHLH